MHALAAGFYVVYSTTACTISDFLLLQTINKRKHFAPHSRLEVQAAGRARGGACKHSVVGTATMDRDTKVYVLKYLSTHFVYEDGHSLRLAFTILPEGEPQC